MDTVGKGGSPELIEADVSRKGSTFWSRACVSPFRKRQNQKY